MQRGSKNYQKKVRSDIMAIGSNRRVDIDIVANDRATSTFNQVGTGMQSMAVKMNNGVLTINSALHRYNSAMNGMYRSTQIALAGSGYLVYRFTKEAVQNFAEFERQHGKTMGAIASNYGKAQAEQARFMADQKKMKEESIKLGTFGPTGNGALYNPTEVSYAQTALSKSGMKNVDQINSVLPTILKFAGGNDLGIDVATDYAVNIGNMFSKPVEEWADMLDKITRAADISTIDVPDVFESLKYTGPIAAQMGRSLEEVLAMIAILGNNGIKGSMSGNGIQSLFTRILSPVGKSDATIENSAPSKHAEKVFKDFVAGTTDSTGKFKDMVDVTAELDTAIGLLNDKEQAWFSHKLFGLYQMKSGLTLAGNGGDTLQGVIDDITDNSSGTNDKKWDIMLDTSYGKQTAFSNAMYGMQQDLGYRLSPITNQIYDELFGFLSNKGNYNVDFTALRSALEESVRMIDEQYGPRFAETFQNIGNLALDGGRAMNASSPLLGGLVGGLAELLNGDVTGAIKIFSDAIGDTNENIEQLPPELQEMASQVRNVILALMAITGVNFAAKLTESLTSIWSATIGRMVNTNKMSVNAANVSINGTGLGGGTGAGTSGGGIILGSGSNSKTSGGNKQIVDQYGNPISSSTTATTPKSNGIGNAIGKGAMVYSVLEALGLNDKALDAIGVDGEAREIVDKIRSGIDGTITVGLLDQMLVGGAGRRALAGMAGKGTSALSGAWASGGAGGVASMLAPWGVVAGTIGIMSKDLENQKNIQTEINRANQEGNKHITVPLKTPWWDPNGIFHGGGASVVNMGDVKKDSDKIMATKDYVYPDSMMSARPELSTWQKLNPFGGAKREEVKKAQEEWDAALQQLQVDRERFKSAQKIVEETSGVLLKYEEYSKDKWSKSPLIDQTTGALKSGESGFNIEEYLGKIDTYTGKVDQVLSRPELPPIVNVGAPNVDVMVNVDRDGNSTVSKITTPATINTIDEAYRTQSSRIGRTSGPITMLR